MSKLRTEILDRQHAAFNYLKEKRELWDEMENLFHNKLSSKITDTTKSQVFDPKLSTLAMERAYRVMAQVQTGKVIGMSSNDQGDAKLKNLILDKYVIPNANAQFDFLTKMRMVDMYSNIYGNFFTLRDWDVKKNGYVGPDVWLLNIRDVFPQVGAVSIEDSDYIIIRSWRPLSYFESLGKDKEFKNISKIVEKLKDKSGSKGVRDSENTSKRDEDQYPQSDTARKAGYFEVFSQYEGDRWVDFCVDADMEFRDTDNPHEDGELPVDCKYSIPLLDDFMGMGDFERGASMQKTINSIWNLYLDGTKISIFPPTLINKDNIASMSSLQWKATAKWLVRGNINNAVQPIQLSPQGIQQFNNTYQVATASLLNMFGTTDTAVSESTDPGMGKTPQAISHLKERENTRDNADRFYMEQYLTKLMKGFVNLISKKQSSEITIRMFEDELENLTRDYPEMAENYDETTGKLSIKKGKKSMLYDYEIVPSSTYAQDQKAQQEIMGQLLEMYLKSQTPNGNQLVMDLKNEGFDFKFGELFKRTISNAGIQDWDKILVEMTDQEKAQNLIQGMDQQFQAALQQSQMNSIPPTPEMIGEQMGETGEVPELEQMQGQAAQIG